MPCLICKKEAEDKLCKKHSKVYMWDDRLKGIRLRKRGAGSRYTSAKYHNTEKNVTRIVEKIYGMSEVVTAWHPIWAKNRKGVLYEFDIYIPKYKLLIEYNGAQHYKYTPFFHKTKKAFIKQKTRDRTKKRMAERNGYTLVVIKYDEPIVHSYIKNKLGEVHAD